MTLQSIPGAAFLRRWAGRSFLDTNEWLWNRLPASVIQTRPMQAYGAFLHSLVKIRSTRRQFFGTYFLRNRPELEQLRALCSAWPNGSLLRLTILASSNGAEVYSMVWAIRSARPDLKLVVHAVDISSEILEIARQGVYARDDHGPVDAPIFERLTEQEFRTLFDEVDGKVRVKDWIRAGIDWQLGDAMSHELVAGLGPQDIVVANRFLCHMEPADADRCLRNIARLVRADGYLFVSGVDLDIRTRVARDLAWVPVRERLEDIHDGDPSVRNDWPWHWWGLEPIDRDRPDWALRYAAVFQLKRAAGSNAA